MAFDGNVPHCTLSCTGTRITLVYFTRKRWLAAETEVLEQLGNLGIRIPGAEYLQRGTRLPSAAEDLEANEDLDSDDERAEIEDDVHEWLDENPESFENVEQ